MSYILLVKKGILMTSTDKLSRKLLGTTWLAGNASCTLVIPKSLAREYGIDQPSNIVIEGRPDGILIRKMEI
ncbi:MAG: AbrB/MazE/SpoVT family DNA-binding domain-containing protein [Nitrososphaeraceae archaeon]